MVIDYFVKESHGLSAACQPFQSLLWNVLSLLTVALTQRTSRSSQCCVYAMK